MRKALQIGFILFALSGPAAVGSVALVAAKPARLAVWVSTVRPMQALRLFHAGLLLTTLIDLALFGPLTKPVTESRRKLSGASTADSR